MDNRDNVAGVDYSNPSNLEIQKKIAAIKNPKNNPANFKLPFDRLNAYMYRWTTQMDHIKHASDDIKHKMASDYYRKYIKPQFLAMRKAPPTEEQWLQSAYDISKPGFGQWNLESHYENQLYYGVGSAWEQGLSAGAQFLYKAYNFSTAMWNDTWNPSTSHFPSPTSGHFWKDVEKDSNAFNPQLHKHLQESVRRFTGEAELLDKLRPFRNAGDAAGYVFGAGGLLAPLNAVIPGLPLEIEAEEGVGLGLRFASNYYRAGVEGLAWGTATRPIGTETKAFDDAANFALSSIALTALGAGRSKVWGGLKYFFTGEKDLTRYKFWGGRIIDDSPPPGGVGTPSGGPKTPPAGVTTGPITGTTPSMEEALKSWQKRVEEGIEVDTDATRQATEQGVADTVVHHGVEGQSKLDEMAAQHMLDMEKSGMNPEQIYAHERKLWESGSEDDKKVLEAVLKIRSLIQNRALGSLSRDERASVLATMKMYAQSAGRKYVKYLPWIQKAIKRQITSLPNENIDMQLVQNLMPKVMQKLGANATPEAIADAIKNELAESLLKAHIFADDLAISDPIAKGIRAETDMNRAIKKTPKPVMWLSKARQAVKYKSGGKLFNKAWVAYASDAIAGRGGKFNVEGIKNFVEGLSGQDFAADIHAFFIPKFLKDIDLTFEHRMTASGPDYSNLYAFAWNFRDQMPPAYAERLDREIQNSSVLKSFYDDVKNSKLPASEKKKILDGMIRKQAALTWNHVDNFLNSGHFPEQRKMYQALGTYAADTKEWGRQMLSDRERYEQDIIDNVFKRSTPEHRAASDALWVSHDYRRQAYESGEYPKERIQSEYLKEQLSKGKKMFQKGGEGSPHYDPSKGVTSSSKRAPMDLAKPYKKEDVVKKSLIKQNLNKISRALSVGSERSSFIRSKMDVLSRRTGVYKKLARARDNILVKMGNLYFDQQRFQRMQNTEALGLMPGDITKGPAGAFHVNAEDGKVSLFLNGRLMTEVMKVLEPDNPMPELPIGSALINEPNHIAQVKAGLANILKPDAYRDLAELIDSAMKNARSNQKVSVGVYRAGEPAEQLQRAIYDDGMHEWLRELAIEGGRPRKQDIEMHRRLGEEIREGEEEEGSVLDQPPEPQSQETHEYFRNYVDPLYDAFDSHSINQIVQHMPNSMLGWLANAPEISEREYLPRVFEGINRLLWDEPGNYTGPYGDLTEHEQGTFALWFMDFVVGKFGPDALDKMTMARYSIDVARRIKIAEIKGDEFVPPKSQRFHWPGGFNPEGGFEWQGGQREYFRRQYTEPTEETEWEDRPERRYHRVEGEQGTVPN